MQSLPSVLAHGDYKPGNMIFSGDEVVAVTDWETARYQPRVWEVLRALCLFCKIEDDSRVFYSPIDLNRAKIFLDAYQEVNPLLPEERRIMFDLANIASLMPSSFFNLRYIKNNNVFDKYFPPDAEHWYWWRDHREEVRESLF